VAELWRTTSGAKYSALDQINRANVGSLQVAWTYHTGEISSGTDDTDATVSELTPVMPTGISTSAPVRARRLARSRQRAAGVVVRSEEATQRQHVCRELLPGRRLLGSAGPAGACRRCGKRVLLAGQTGMLMAIDADRGRLCPGFGQGGGVNLAALDYKGEGPLANTSPPAIYRNVVIVGASVTDNKFRNSLDGIVRAFDVVTGRELWAGTRSARTFGPDRRRQHLGADLDRRATRLGVPAHR
jgi:quinoprotein glucose dehydrogenase